MNGDDDEVIAAAELLLEELGRSVDDVKEQTGEALRANRFDEAQRLAGVAEAIVGLADDVRKIEQNWLTLGVRRTVGVADAPGDEPTSEHARRYLGRVKRGTRTPEAAFRVPILTALAEAGGPAPLGDVLDRVGALMADVLNDVDRQPLPSDADAVRWRNTAQWSRNELVKLGLMAPSRERGVWEIADAGRRFLAEHDERT